MYKKKLIVFEGIEGSGKTTHINYISRYLKKKRIQHIRIREPGGSKSSEKIRKLLLSNRSDFNNKTDRFWEVAVIRTLSNHLEKIRSLKNKKRQEAYRESYLTPKKRKIDLKNRLKFACPVFL